MRPEYQENREKVSAIPFRYSLKLDASLAVFITQRTRGGYKLKRNLLLLSSALKSPLKQSSLFIFHRTDLGIDKLHQKRERHREIYIAPFNMFTECFADKKDTDQN